MDVTGILLVALAAGLAILLFMSIALGWMPKNDAGGASLTAFHDFQPVDKQRATEIVIEQKAGKRWSEQTSGDTGHDEDAECDKKDGPQEGKEST